MNEQTHMEYMHLCWLMMHAKMVSHSTSTSEQLKRYSHYVFKINIYCFFVMQCEVDCAGLGKCQNIFSLHSLDRVRSCQFLGCQYWLMTLFRIALNTTQLNNGKWFSEKVLFIPCDPNTREIAINVRSDVDGKNNWSVPTQRREKSPLHSQNCAFQTSNA